MGESAPPPHKGLPENVKPDIFKSDSLSLEHDFVLNWLVVMQSKMESRRVLFFLFYKNSHKSIIYIQKTKR